MSFLKIDYLVRQNLLYISYKRESNKAFGKSLQEGLKSFISGAIFRS